MLFRSEKTESSKREREDRVQRTVTDVLRRMARLFSTVADLVEAKRLEQKGYSPHQKHLERVEEKHDVQEKRDA